MTDTIEQQLRQGLAALRDAAPAQPFDPADDLARGRAARRNARSRSLTVAAGSVTALAVAGALWVHGDGAPPLRPAGSGTSSVAAGDVTRPPATSTPVSESATTAPSLTTGQLGARMVAVMREHASDADRYLGGWGDDSSGSGVRKSYVDGRVGRFQVNVSWGRAGSSSLGGVEIGSTTARFARREGQAAMLRCNNAFNDAPSVCRLVREDADGGRLYYGSAHGTRAATYVHADGRTTYVVVMARQGGNSLTATTAPLPSKSQLVAIATDSKLLWDGTLVESSPYESPGDSGWSTPHP